VVAIEEIRSGIEDGLREQGSPERAVQEKRYLKSDLEFFGTGRPALHRIVKAEVKGASLGHDDMVALVESLWASNLFELRSAAVEVLVLHPDLVGPEDVPLLERMLRGSMTWALVDELAATVVGELVERHPSATSVLDRWAGDEDFWIRRSALLALLRPLRRGDGDFERFAGYADAMLEEKEFFIRKAIGWVLRETAKNHPDLVYEWMSTRTHRVSGVTVREVVRWLPDDQKQELLRAYQATRPVRG
jgi:3-methyladenine DNA glycosylase AlkD